MSFLQKGYASVEQKAEQVKKAMEGKGTIKFPFLYLGDSQADPDPDRPSMVFGRFLDNDPITFNTFILEKGKVHFMDYDGNPLRETFKPSFRGVFPFLVYPVSSPEFQEFLDSMEDEELRDDTDQRLIKVEVPTVYRAEFSFKVLQTLQSINKRKKLTSGNILVTRVGSGAQDTVYQFEHMGKSALDAQYGDLELPDWESLYKLPDEKEIEIYMTKGFEGLKSFREKNKSTGGTTSSKPATKSKKSADDEDEVDVDWA